MSSYFSIKLREKKTDKILSLNCWSRNDAVYQLFVNNISVPYADCPERDEHGDFKYDKNGCMIYKPTLYHKLTSEDFKTVLEEANKEIKFYKDLLVGIKDKQKAIANYIKLIAKTTTKEEADKYREDLDTLKESIEYNYIYENQEELEDLLYAKNIILGLENIFEGLEYSDFSEMLCNYD